MVVEVGGCSLLANVEGFGALLRKFRLRAGLTQEELAEMSGVSARTISQLETGKRGAPRVASVRMLAQALSLDAEERATLLNVTAGHTEDGDAGDPSPKPMTTARPQRKKCFLPRGVPDFVGRKAELDRLLGPAAAMRTESMAVTVVDGTAGVGKTAFAVHAAHLLAERYPDGQFFCDLHGFTPNRGPLDMMAALRALLRMADVPAERIPASLDERSAFWRAALAGRQVLVVLDNVGEPGCVHPLLPGTAGSHVMVTSRRRATTVDGSTSISLDVLRPDEAIALFVETAGRDRTCDELDAVAEIVRLCGFLPLGIRIAASRLRSRPSWTVSRLAERLRARAYRLSELDADGEHGVAAALMSSYRVLNADQQKLFTQLGHHPAVHFDAHSVAVFAGMPLRQVERLLDELVDHHVLMEPVAGRYTFHELLRDHAKALAISAGPPDDRADPIDRLLAHQM
ncbi:hypothetical protein DMH04_26755 [Kibdelosporangium aridum]|uniref:HTH cro/C1-type domain-containing protein n=1 Tax=Kibdelosporangium aridum TaxID=2030 RepID=A0A428Z548_KIBAR|nr:hypothetical protein DMH04_26755 [Kibdelosporangium aridum]